ncbi:hypothetical protein AKJ58_00125 [candidate division MSBL1 archaeon SCGC-AAA385D11]|uniref:Uncharacterized protein n=1 Tax=candidate division MSBL1 archaeon SCGC-AAA385D11 TaxID=1698286 RepID=A0A133VPI5_9EURY|nr:hypothetical protein AKJ58_00125 [candidate division MSBL1 archaeon SCGC-AAA385D11]
MIPLPYLTPVGILIFGVTILVLWSLREHLGYMAFSGIALTIGIFVYGFGKVVEMLLGGLVGALSTYQIMKWTKSEVEEWKEEFKKKGER